jgi:hypothetical protein
MATGVIHRRVEGQRRMATGVHREWGDGVNPSVFCFFTGDGVGLIVSDGPTNARCEI